MYRSCIATVVALGFLAAAVSPASAGVHHHRTAARTSAVRAHTASLHVGVFKVAYVFTRRQTRSLSANAAYAGSGVAFASYICSLTAELAPVCAAGVGVTASWMLGTLARAARQRQCFGLKHYWLNLYIPIIPYVERGGWCK